MTSPFQIVTYDRAAQRIVCPHRDTAVPSGGVTITILDSAGAEKVASTAASKGALSTTLGAAAAAAGARSITVGSISGAAAGDPIVISDAAGRSEVAIIEGLSGTTIQLRDRLSRSYAITTSTVKSALIYYDLDASDATAWPPDVGFQAIFDCTTWSAPRIVLFRVVDAPPACPIEFDDVRGWCPDASQIVDSNDQSNAADYRAAAWEIIRTRVESMGQDPEVWRGERAVRSVGGLLAAGLLLLAHGRVERSRALVGDTPGDGGLFASHWSATAASLGWFDEDQDRAVDRGEQRPIGSGLLRRSL